MRSGTGACYNIDRFDFMPLVLFALFLIILVFATFIFILINFDFVHLIVDFFNNGQFDSDDFGLDHLILICLTKILNALILITFYID